MLEHLVVALVVAGAFVYAVWTLVPAVRRAFGRRAGGGACGGCDSCESGSGAKPKPAEQPIRIVRTPPRQR